MKTFMNNQCTRRQLLQATALTAGLVSPLLTTHAALAPQRNRVIFVYTPMGAPIDWWEPRECGSTISLPRASAPLNPVKHHCVFLNNLYVPYAGPGFTPKVLGGGSGASGDTTLDIRLGEALSAGVQLPNLHLSTGEYTEVASHKENTKIAFAHDAAAIYETLFDARNQELNTPIDKKFRAELAAPTTPDFDKKVDQLIELSALALTRNTTNVITLMWSDCEGGFHLPESFTQFPRQDFHYAAHMHGEFYAAFRAYLTGKLAYLIQLLAMMRDQYNQSLLDTTLVVHVTDQGDGSNHLGEKAPFLLAGGKNLFRNGAVLDVNRKTQNELMDTIAAAYSLHGVQYGSGVIDGLRT